MPWDMKRLKQREVMAMSETHRIEAADAAWAKRKL